MSTRPQRRVGQCEGALHPVLNRFVNFRDYKHRWDISGVANNLHQLDVTAALANLLLVRRKLLNVGKVSIETAATSVW